MAKVPAQKQSAIPEDADEAKLLFEALRIAEQRLGCSSEDILVSDVTPFDPETTVAAWTLPVSDVTPFDPETTVAAWTLPVGEDYILWIWSRRGIAKFEWTPTRSAVWENRVFAVLTPVAGGQWTFGPFYSANRVEVINWILDAAVQPLDQARTRTVELVRIRKLQRGAISAKEKKAERKQVADAHHALTLRGHRR